VVDRVDQRLARGVAVGPAQLPELVGVEAHDRDVALPAAGAAGERVGDAGEAEALAAEVGDLLDGDVVQRPGVEHVKRLAVGIGHLEHRVDDVGDVDVGLALLAVAEDGQARRVLTQPAHEVIGDAVGLTRADDVGEAEDDDAEAEHVRVGRHHGLAGELAGAVGGDRVHGARVLAGRLLTTVTVDARARRVHDLGDTGHPGRLDGVVGQVGALPEVDGRLGDRLGDVRVGREEEHPPAALDRGTGRIKVLQITSDERQALVIEDVIQIGDSPRGEVVVDDHFLVRIREQVSRHVAADEAGATGDERARHRTAVSDDHAASLRRDEPPDPA
jgi:hypothetical protein